MQNRPVKNRQERIPLNKEERKSLSTMTFHFNHTIGKSQNKDNAKKTTLFWDKTVKYLENKLSQFTLHGFNLIWQRFKKKN